MLTDGQQMTAPLNYAPLPPAVVDEEQTSARPDHGRRIGATEDVGSLPPRRRTGPFALPQRPAIRAAGPRGTISPAPMPPAARQAQRRTERRPSRFADAVFRGVAFAFALSVFAITADDRRGAAATQSCAGAARRSVGASSGPVVLGSGRAPLRRAALHLRHARHLADRARRSRVPLGIGAAIFLAELLPARASRTRSPSWSSCWSPSRASSTAWSASSSWCPSCATLGQAVVSSVLGFIPLFAGPATASGCSPPASSSPS